MRHSTIYSYNADGKIICQTDPSGDIINTYDNQGRLSSVTDVRGNITTMEYDGDTEKVVTINYPTYTREYSYDARGRMTQVNDLAGDSTRSTLYNLDTLGQIVSITDPLNRTAYNQYDQLGRRLAMVNALGATNGFEYNVFGSLTKIIDANGNQTMFEYDLNGRLTRKTYADSSFWQYEYDAIGNLVKRTDGKGQITAYAYDFLGRLATNACYSSSTSYPSSPSRIISFSYDNQNRMTAWSSSVAGGGGPGFSASFAYDDTNHVQTVTVNYGSFSKSFAYSYDLAGRKTAFTYPTPAPTNSDTPTLYYSYDAEGLLNEINIPGEGTISYSMNQYGQLSGQNLPGGNNRNYGYDAMMSMMTNVALDSAQNPLLSRVYSRNLAGNILAQNTEQGDYAYEYDLIDQLTNIFIDGYSGPVGAATNEAFVYDAMGNKLSSSTVKSELGTLNSTYSVNSLNQYSEISNTESQITLQYDANGSVTNKTSATETNTFTWDIENRMVEFQKIATNGVTFAQYTYDPFGRRLSKVVNGVTNYYLYADEGLIAEYDSAGNETKSYAYKPNSLWMNDPVFMRQSGSSTGYYYFVNDHLGAPQKLTDKNGLVVWSLVCDAFGHAVVSSNSTIICNLRFSSQYYDEESGMHYNTMRYYDPISGRFLSQDPIGEMGGINLMAFVMNNPVNLRDTWGFSPSEADDECTTYSLADYIAWLQSQGIQPTQFQLNQLKRGCIGVVCEAQNRAGTPEAMADTKCYLSQAEANDHKKECPSEKPCHVVFAKQGRWRNGKAPTPGQDGSIRRDSIISMQDNDPNVWNYVLSTGDYYVYMNQGAKYGEQFVTVCKRTPRIYDATMWCGSCVRNGRKSLSYSPP